MNKQAAAKYLNVTEKTLQNYVKMGKLSVYYEKDKNIKRAIFNKEELDKVKVELEKIQYSPIIAPQQSQTSLVQIPQDVMFKNVSDLLLQVVKQLKNQDEISTKLTLTIKESSKISNLSQLTLKRAIQEKKLMAIIDNRRTLIRKQDLEAFIESLTMKTKAA